MCGSIYCPSAPTWRSVSVRSSIPACSPASSRRTGALPAGARPIWTARRRLPSRATCCSTIVWSIRLRAADSEPLRDAAVAGMGVVLLPTWLVGEDIKAGRLRHLLPEWSSMIATKPSGIFGVFPPHRRVPPQVRAFLDFAQKRFGKPPYWDPDWTEDRHKASHDVTEQDGSESVT